MAKRGRAVSIDKLVKQLNQLDNQRKALTSRIRQAVGSLLGAGAVRGGADLASPAADGRSVEGGGVKAAAGRKRAKKRTMSAAARKAISDAQKRRWAKQKAAAAK